MKENLLMLVVGGAAAVASYFVWPSIRDHRAPSWVSMQLDPDVKPGEVEDRRSRPSDMGRDLGGSDIGRMGPGPRGGPGGDVGPWGEARGDAGPGDGGGRGGGGLRCRDALTGRDVPMSFCDRERGRR
jgi:hypothetical protein